MGINLGGSTTNASVLTPAPAPVNGIINMEKRQTLDITKKNPGLSKIRLGLGWDVSGGSSTFDLDAWGISLNENDKAPNTNYVCYFGNPKTPGVMSMGDNLTGQGDGDDETIMINLLEVPSEIKSIKLFVSIYQAISKRQNFGMINNAYIRLINDVTGNELCRFILTDDYSTSTSVEFAEVERQADGNWNFNTIGVGSMKALNEIAEEYL